LKIARRCALAPSEKASAKALWEKSVKKAKQCHWKKKKLEQASRSSIWSITMRHTMAHSKAIPELDGSPDFEEKCEKLRRFLFPEPLAPLPYISDDFVTPLQDLSDAFDVVTATEVVRTLRSVNKNSAVGNDPINFTTLIYVNEAIPSLLPTLITALFRFGIHHKSWKEAICVAIPEQGKKSYTTPTSYHQISLLSCLGKVVEKIASKCISVAASKCGAISRSQFGNKENHSENDALFKTLTGDAHHYCHHISIILSLSHDHLLLHMISLVLSIIPAQKP
jgi:hypothetical protein